MSKISLKCQSCGADLSYNIGDEKLTCKQCGSSFSITDIIKENKKEKAEEKEEVLESKSANGQLLKTKTEFDISASALGCVMFVALTILFSVILTVTGIRVKMGSFAYFVLHATVEGIFALAAVIVAKSKKTSLIKAAAMDKKVNGNIVALSFAIALVSLLGFGNLTNVFIEFLCYFGFSTEGGNIVINNFWQYLGMVFSSCAVAGFAEELLFRGVIESGFKKWGMKVAVGFSALIFMIMHGSALQTVHQLIIGILIGYVFYKTNNLWLGVLIHFFNNFIPITEVYILSLVSKSSAEVAAETVGLGTIFVDLIIALVIAYAGYYFINILIKKLIAENEKVNGKNKEAETTSSIKVDGENQEVEMTIDGTPAETSDELLETKKAEKPTISGGTIAMFSIAGLYLVIEWLIGTISRFMWG